MSASPLCDIVIPIWDQPELSRRCLESILRCTPEPIRLILVDNGSKPPPRQMLDQFRTSSSVPIEIIRNETNLGFIRGVNQGIRAARSVWICLLNNDTVVTAGWLSEMLRVGEADPSIGLINPTSNSLGFDAGKIPLEEYAAELKKQSGKTTELTVALGFCLLAKRSLFDRIGVLNEAFGMGYFEDDDLSRRVRGAGLRCVRACASYVYHEEKGSFRHLEGHEKSFNENKQKFEKIWGKRLRILWPLYPAGPFPKEEALRLVGQGHWLYLMAPDGTLPADLTSHAQVTCLKATSATWRLRATARLIIRRKKPFDVAISHDPAWARWIGALRWLHRAQLIQKPTGAEILRRCEELARQ